MRWILLLVIIIGNIVVIPFVNTIHPTVLGFPFILFWVFLWMVLSPFITWWIYVIDNKAKREV